MLRLVSSSLKATSVQGKMVLRAASMPEQMLARECEAVAMLEALRACHPCVGLLIMFLSPFSACFQSAAKYDIISFVNVVHFSG